MSWFTNWDDAVKHPRRTTIWMGVCGFAGGALVGYFRFDHSAGYAIALGLGMAFVLGVFGWRTVTDPERVEQLKNRRASVFRGASMRLAIQFAGLGLATIAGIATGSIGVFVIVFAIALVIGLLVGRSLPR